MEGLVSSIETYTEKLAPIWAASVGACEELLKAQSDQAAELNNHAMAMRALEKSTATAHTLSSALLYIIQGQRQLETDLKKTVDESAAAIEENRKLQQQRDENIRTLIQSVAREAEATNRSIRNQPPSKEEWDVVGVAPNLYPLEELTSTDRQKYGYENSTLTASILPEDPLIVEIVGKDREAIQHLSEIDGQKLRSFIDGLFDSSKKETVDYLSKTQIHVIWKDNRGHKRLHPKESLLSQSREGLRRRQSGSSLKSDQLRITDAPKVSLATALTLLCLNRAHFRTAGMLLSLLPQKLFEDLELYHAREGFIFSGEVVFWALHHFVLHHGIAQIHELAKAGEYDLQCQAPLKGIISIVEHLLRYPNNAERGQIRSRVSGLSTPAAREGMAQAAHSDHDLFVSTLTILLRPAVFYKKGSSEEILENNVVSYAFVLAIVRKAFDLFFKELGDSAEKTLQNAEIATVAISAVLSISGTAADILPGGNAGKMVLKSMTEVTLLLAEKFKNVRPFNSGKNNPDKKKIIDELEKKVSSTFGEHVGMEKTESNRVLGFMVQATPQSEGTDATDASAKEKEIKNIYANQLESQFTIIYDKLEACE